MHSSLHYIIALAYVIKNYSSAMMHHSIKSFRTYHQHQYSIREVLLENECNFHAKKKRLKYLVEIQRVNDAFFFSKMKNNIFYQKKKERKKKITKRHTYRKEWREHLAWFSEKKDSDRIKALKVILHIDKQVDFSSKQSIAIYETIQYIYYYFHSLQTVKVRHLFRLPINFASN